MLRFRLKSASCVVIGTFNIYVVQPDLLVKMKVFKLEHPPIVSGDFTKPGMRFEVGNAVWTVRPDRLAVESTNPSENCGHFVERTLEALRWTPVFAVGVNLDYEAVEEFPTDSLVNVALPDFPEADQRAIQFGIPQGDSFLNLHLAHVKSKGTLSMRLNVHTDLAKYRNDPERASEIARQACREYFDSIQRAREVAGRLFAVEWDHE